MSRVPSWGTYAVGIVTAVALIAGCNGSGTQPPAVPNALSPSGPATGAVPPLEGAVKDTFVGVYPIGDVRRDRRRSWVSAAVKHAPRLYFASDSGTDDVYVYVLPGMKLAGTLSGFDEPQGECADNEGNVYIVNTNLSQTLKYSRTGTLLATYGDAYGYPVGCAWDPATGDLAVTDIFDFSNSGDVLIYRSPSSPPIRITNPKQYDYYFAGYDSDGHLWVDGKDSKGFFMLSACGRSQCTTIHISGGTIYFPGAVQWDATRTQWVVFDQLCGDTAAACSYPVSDRGVLGAATTYRTYNGNSVCDLIQGVIAANGRKYVVGGDYEYCAAATSAFNRWAYTAGGPPTNDAAAGNPYALPVGAAISTKK